MEELKGTQSGVVLDVQNSGEPIRLTDVDPWGGVSAEAAQEGDQVKIWTRLGLSSDDPFFHRVVEGLEGAIVHMAEQSGVALNLRRASTVLLIFRPDRTAEIWVDTAAVALQCRVKRSKPAGSVIFESDIADVNAMSFPKVMIKDADKVLCLFREGWSFGLAFDFSEGGADLEWFSATLGKLHRTLHYRHLYDAVNNPAVFEPLKAAGWFPFAEIITAEFRSLAQQVEAGFDLAEVEAKVLASFDSERLGHLLERWLAKPHFSAKEALLREAIDSFVSGRPVSVIKIVLTEIEGVLNDAYRVSHGRGAKLKQLLEFAQMSAEERAGGPDTLLFPTAFGQYLSDHTFANFDPATQDGTAGSRHAVGHGAASQGSYTMTRALQAILTLDQLAFYT